MEILKTKQERHESAIETSTKTIAEVCEKVETYKKLTITFDRSDFKDELSIPFGFAFQDMKKENRIL